MKLQGWLEWKFIKEGFINLFWDFHYIALFGILTLVISLGVVTAGPALMALAASTRLIADSTKVSVSYYFKQFKRLFKPGLAISAFLIVAGLSLRSSLIILSSSSNNLHVIAAYTAISVITVLLFFFFYYPFAGFNEDNMAIAFKKSFYYVLGHLWNTVVQISILYLLWRLLSISMLVAAILFPPIGTYIINRFIIANNRQIDGQ